MVLLRISRPRGTCSTRMHEVGGGLLSMPHQKWLRILGQGGGGCRFF
ncbi:hypothetical protein [Streptomyces fagopyri]